MRRGLVKYNGELAGELLEDVSGEYVFTYDPLFAKKHPDRFITFNMPVTTRPYRSKQLFPFFDGLIPEGWLLNIATRSWKINPNDRMGLLLACCQNAIGAVSVHPVNTPENE